MIQKRNEGGQQPPTLTYQIRVEGHLPPHWAAEFAGLTLTLEAEDVTCMTGPVVDQAALHGLLRKIRDLGLPLISLKRLSGSQAE